MNQAILKIIEDSKKRHSTPMWIMVTEYFEKQLSSLSSDIQWIDVKDELPKDWKIVLINEWWIVIHWYNEWGTMYKLPTDKLSYCTHWMPLPTPPNN